MAVARDHARRALRCASLVSPDLDPDEFRDMCLYLMFRACAYLDYDVLWEMRKPPWIYAQGSPEKLIANAAAIGGLDRSTIEDPLTLRIWNMLHSG